MSSDLQGSNPQESGSKKPPTKILENELVEAREALDRSVIGLGLSGLSAGLELGFSLLLIAITLSMAKGVLSHPVVELLSANMYSFGFILVVIGRSELFTEQTSLAVMPLLDGQTSLGAVARLWLVVYITNMFGAAIFAAITVAIGPPLDVIEMSAFEEIAHRMVAHRWWVILLSAILAGWLMGLLSWLVAAGRDTISQIVIVWLITAAIGLAHLHHSVAGAVEVMAGYFSGTGTTLAGVGHFLLWSSLGNAIGGPLFVALLKYGHAKPGTPVTVSTGHVAQSIKGERSQEQ